MNRLKFFAVALAFVSMASQARSIQPDAFRGEVAPVLSQIEVTNVALKGEVLKENSMHPYTNFTIAIPVMVSTGSACTTFVGQQTKIEESGLQSIQMMGSTDPIVDACIEIFPMPVKSLLTFNFQVVTGGFVPADPIQTQIIQILPLGMYEVTLNMNNNSVTVRAIRLSHRN